MRNEWKAWATVTPFLLLLAVACSAPPTETDARITTTIDESIESESALPDAEDGGARPLAAAWFDAEPQSDFVTNELIVVPDDAAELDRFLADWNGVVLATIETPGGTTRYHVRVDSDGVDLANADEVLSELALGSGALSVSSEAGLRLLVLAARATRAGIDVSVNWTMSSDTFEDGSLEDGFDVMNRPYMRAGSNQDIGVDEAWLALERSGRLDDAGHRVDVGVIDGGFFANDDFPGNVLHASFVSGDAAVDSPNPTNCSGGNPCPFHGTGAANTLAGLADNGFGGAGPAGPVVGRLVTAHVTLDAATVMSAASYLHAAGVEIINMSFGGRISATWAWWSVDDYAEHLRAIGQSGVILVAAAGNEATDVDAGETPSHDPKVHYPCEFQGVVCVGALANDSTSRISYSNYGGFHAASGVYSDGTVDLWAPTNIRVAASPFGPGDLTNFGGTSAASPFAAGIFALVRAADPTAPLADTYAAVWTTTNSGSSDPDVGVWPNARDAVLAVLGDASGIVDIVEPTGPYDEYDDIPLRAEIDDQDSSPADYVIGWGYLNAAGTFIGLGSSAHGETIEVRLCDGSYEIEAIAVNSATGATATSSVSIEVTQPDTPPARCAPEVTIVTPDDGAVFASGAEVAFEAVIEDDDDATDEPIHSVVWREDGPTSPILAQDVLAFETSSLAAGVYDVHVSYGTAEDTITIEILDTTNEAPNAVIGEPDDGEVLIYSDYDYAGGSIEVPAGGLAHDPEDGFLDDAAHAWSYRLSGTTTWSSGGTGIQVTLTLPFVGDRDVWEIRLSATDSDGLIGTDTHTITVVTPPQ